MADFESQGDISDNRNYESLIFWKEAEVVTMMTMLTPRNYHINV